MCGIAGMLRLDGATINRSLVEQMTNSLAHRGPDDAGIWSAGVVGFGHRRLAIRGLGPDGHQPMSDPSGKIWVSFNGEIYNDGSLAAELSRDYGLVRRTTCDTEIIPLGYQAWGEDIFSRLEGMFAIALWDSDRQKLLLARDAIGIKPLFVQEDGQAVRFASEIKGILADSSVRRRIDPGKMSEFLALGYTAPDSSLLEDVRQVPPGTLLIHENGRWRSKVFWAPRRSGEIRRLDEATEALGATLQTVVSDMLVSDVPIGVLQSGGVDSSLVSLSLPQDSQVPMFTASFDEASHDESALAGQMAASTRSPHHLIPVERSDNPIEIFRTMAMAYDGQLFDSSGYAFLPLARHVRKSVTVALSGDGADEFLGGYSTYRATRFAAKFGGYVPNVAARSLGRLLWRMRPASEHRLPVTEALARLITALPHGEAAHTRWRRLGPEWATHAIAGSDLKQAISQTDAFSRYRSVMNGSASVTDRALLADQRYHLPGDLLRKTDAMSMAAGLEVRVPFLDRRIMDLAGRMDVPLLMGCISGNKLVARNLLKSLGAPEMVAKGAKQGFNVPVARLLRGPLAPLANRYFSDEVDAFAPLFRPAEIKRLWLDHLACEFNHGYLLWALLVYAVWMNS
ncbi:asparagine synthase (glutamine-hydrolyzing) [Rhizobium sp. BK376]|uniref:asparagine synthase (glutamine-hydrolyzing) n=1 Tax=Rhizobium sp. BK376 TaxID=2512149 RepID=UPI00104D3290|nr:asparagine synthase (glutamine-hydrolyzing) [Rhizobium sp. BK376]TCR66936.1 asparagine synthase (glutamine-hydrolysing) [Rhizobium sp. BK376]